MSTMSNELLLIFSLVLIYGLTLLFYTFFGKSGLYAWTAIVTIAANIEVLLLIKAFGIEQTLGNVLFASSFLVSDILSENEGKVAATKAVKIGVLSNISFILLSQFWLLYNVSENDWAREPITQIFSNTPRVMLAGLLVYALSQWLDVRLYHAIWEKSIKIFGNSYKALWLRNNLSTIISQMFNTVLFTFAAFYGEYEMDVLISIVISSYLIYVFTALCDTPAVYASRFIKKRRKY